MNRVGWLDCVWREGDELYGSIRLDDPCTAPREFVVRCSISRAKKDGAIILGDVWLTKSVYGDIFRDGETQTAWSRVGLLRAELYPQFEITRDHLDSIVSDLHARGLEGYKPPVLYESCDGS
jgi:hypothetical protein